MNNIQLVDAVPEDAYDIRQVRLKTWIATYPNEEFGITKDDILESFVFKDKQAEEQYYEQRKESIQNDKELHTWVAKDKDKIVGFCVAGIKDPKIIALYVLPVYQGMGLGKSLITEALSWLGNVRVKLEVVSYNTNAIKFYEKFGFVKGGKTHNPVADLPSGKILPEIEMIKE